MTEHRTKKQFFKGGWTSIFLLLTALITHTSNTPKLCKLSNIILLMPWLGKFLGLIIIFSGKRTLELQTWSYQKIEHSNLN